MEMNLLGLLLIIANALTLIWAARLLRRRPARRLSYLILTVSIISVTQTVAYFSRMQGKTVLEMASLIQQCIVATGSLAAVYLLWVEVRDQHRTDHLWRLAEHQLNRPTLRPRHKPAKGLPE
jgi:hypothetical protein